MSEELKHCSSCGYIPVILHNGKYWAEPWYVECRTSKCLCKDKIDVGDFETKEDATRAWNLVQ